MLKIGLRYSLILALVAFFFTNFVACGSQLYQMSLHHDVDIKPTAQTGNASAPMALFGIHSPKGWDHLPIHFRSGNRLTADQISEVQKAMKTWEWAVGRQLFVYDGEHGGVDGDSFKDLYSSLPDMINGTYLDDNWEKTGKTKDVLATTIWDNEPSDASAIETADIRFNGEYYILGDSLFVQSTDTKEVVDLQSLALHELGHFLGLTHISPQDDAQSIMNPSLYIGEGMTTRKLSKGDIQRVQEIYGCIGHSCDVDALIAEQETPPALASNGDQQNSPQDGTTAQIQR